MWSDSLIPSGSTSLSALSSIAPTLAAAVASASHSSSSALLVSAEHARGHRGIVADHSAATAQGGCIGQHSPRHVARLRRNLEHDSGSIPPPKRVDTGRRTLPCTACAATSVQCVGGVPCVRCLQLGNPAACTPIVFPSSVASAQRRGRRRSSSKSRSAATTGATTSAPFAATSSATTATGRATTPTPPTLSTSTSLSPNSVHRGPSTPSASPSPEMTMQHRVVPAPRTFGLVVMHWDSMPFVGQGDAWADDLVASWVGYTPHALGLAFNSYLGVCQLMTADSVIRFFGRVFGALGQRAPTFSCPVTMRCSNGSPLLLQCLGTIQYAASNTMFLQLCLPIPALRTPSSSPPLTRVSRDTLTDPNMSTMAWSSLSSLSVDAEVAMTSVVSSSGATHPWLIDPSPDTNTERLLRGVGPPTADPQSSASDVGDEQSLRRGSSRGGRAGGQQRAAQTTPRNDNTAVWLRTDVESDSSPV